MWLQHRRGDISGYVNTLICVFLCPAYYSKPSPLLTSSTMTVPKLQACQAMVCVYV